MSLRDDDGGGNDYDDDKDKDICGKNRKGMKNVSDRGTVTEEWCCDGRVL